MTSLAKVWSDAAGSPTKTCDAGGVTQWQYSDQISTPQSRLKSPHETLNRLWQASGTYAHSADGVDENLLILLHGFGDTRTPFSQLARSMALPQTATLALDALFQLPFDLEGFAWHHQYNDNADRLPIGHKRRKDSMQQSTDAVVKLIVSLCEDGLWNADRIFLLGYGQGGTCALSVLTTLLDESIMLLGGVVTVCASMFEEHMRDTQRNQSQRTQYINDTRAASVPVLLMCGETDTQVSVASVKSSANHLHQRYGKTVQAKVAVMPKRGSGMFRHASEIRPVMEFFAAHLGRRLIALEDASDVIELNTDSNGVFNVT